MIKPHVPPWGYETQPPYTLGVFWTSDDHPINNGEVHSGLLTAILRLEALYLPPQVGLTVALVDNIDQLVLGYRHDGASYQWWGCQEGFASLELIHDQIEVLDWEFQARGIR